MSDILKLNLQDFAKGLIISVLSAVLSLIVQLLQEGSYLDWNAIGMTALIAGLSYLTKNLLSDSEGKFGGKI